MAFQSCGRKLRIGHRWMSVALLAVVVSLSPTVTAQADEDSVYYCDGKAITLEAMTNQVTIEMKSAADRDKVAAALAERGMPTMLLPTLNSVHGRLRVLPVPNVSEDLLEELRGVEGVRKAYRAYREVKTGHTQLATDRIVVRFRDDLSHANINAFLAAKGIAKVRQLTGLGKTYIVEALDPQRSAVKLAAQLYRDERTRYCHPDFILEHKPLQFTDTYYDLQWHLNNTGQSGATVDADVDWPEAYSIVSALVSPNPIRIAILDDSVQKTHEDYASAWYTGFDFTDFDDDPSPGFFFDDHGTAVTGVAVARANNGIGVVGAAPNASLIGMRWGLTFADDADAFLFASSNGAGVINNSWGPSQNDLPVPDVIRDAVQNVTSNGRSGKGMVVVFAAGNDPWPIPLSNSFAAQPEVIAIGGSTSNDTRVSYSAYGEALEVLAPTWDTTTLGIVTTDVMDDPNLGLPTRGYNEDGFNWAIGLADLPDGSYSQWFNGTSASAPLATGVIGLVLRANNNLTSEQVRRVLQHSADQISPVQANYDPVTGKSEFYGYGRINAQRAVQAALTAAGGSTWPPPVENLQTFGTSTITLSWDPPTLRDPNEEDIRSVLVVQSTSEITWTPSGMREGETPEDYPVGGPPVAANVEVVQNELTTEYKDAEPPTGTLHFAVFVRNDKNRWSWGRKVSTAISTKSAPKASAYATPHVGRAPLDVTFSGGAVDPDEENFLFFYDWDFGELQEPNDPNDSTGQTVAHTYNTPGTYMAELTVTDNPDPNDPNGLSGRASVMIEVLPETTKPLTVSIVPPTESEGFAPLTVLLRASTPTGIEIDQYQWDFGDGTSAFGAPVEHTYVEPGAYAVTLTVTTEDGRSASASLAISVWGSGNSQTGKETPEATGALLPGMCAFATPALIGAMVVWSLLSVRRRRR